MDNHLTSTPSQPAPALPEPQTDRNPSYNDNPPDQKSMDAASTRAIIISIIVVILLIAVIVGAVYYLTRPTTDTAMWRDIFIIFMAIQSLFTGFALIILIIQLARLTNLLQNEIKPILDTTNETVSNLRGTTVFLSDNLVGPVIKLNEYLAGFSQLIQVFGLARKPRRNSSTKGE